MSVDKFRVIEEVQKRPLLWDWKTRPGKRVPKTCAPLWIEIGQVLNANAYLCKRTWNKLRLQLRTEVKRIPTRIARAKEKGEYDPKKKYSSWMYFDALDFLLDWHRSGKVRFNTNFGCDSDSDVEIVEKNDTYHTQLDSSESNSLRTGRDNNIAIVDCDNLDKMHTESDNDIEILADNNIDETQCQKENYFDNLSPKESDNTSQVISIEDSNDTLEDTSFKTYTIPLSACIQDGECDRVFNNSIALQSDSVFQAKPENESEDFPQDYEFIEDDRSSTLSAFETKTYEDLDFPVALREHIPSPSGTKHEENELPYSSISLEEEISSPPGLSDEDYSFLHSFLSQTKAMTQLQKMEFRVNMKNLLVQIFPASASLNILEKQLLLPEDDDPDRKFLISFWPFIKSMSLKQNLQFRVKMAELVHQILSGEAE